MTMFDEYADVISLQQIKNLPHKHAGGRVRPFRAIHAVPGLRQLLGLVVTLVPAVQLQFEQRVLPTVDPIVAPQRGSHVNKIESTLRNDNVPGSINPPQVLSVTLIRRGLVRCMDGGKKKEKKIVNEKICSNGMEQSKMCKDYEIDLKCKRERKGHRVSKHTTNLLQILYCVKFHGINGMVQHGTPPTKKYYKMT